MLTTLSTDYTLHFADYTIIYIDYNSINHHFLKASLPQVMSNIVVKQNKTKYKIQK